MSNSDLFAPIVANAYLAPLGTNISTITGVSSAVPLAFIDLGMIDLEARYPFTPGGAPTRTVNRQVNNSEIYFVSETPSDDLPKWAMTFPESSIQILEAAFGVEIDENGHFTYFGGLPPHYVFLADFATGDALPKKRRVLSADVSIQVNGSIGGDKANPLEKYALEFYPNPNQTQAGGLFEQWNSWLADAS